jgi:single-strand selective monofunctional uracil DNA glycosylase
MVDLRLMVDFQYSPLDYALEPHSHYVHKYCQGPKKLLFLSMNPGPWGMSQTGVPLGEVNMVKNWLRIEGKVGKPTSEHPSRLVEGWNCPRSEVSGQRFWSYFKDLCGEPEVMMREAFVHNYCPLAFMKVRLSGDGAPVTEDIPMKYMYFFGRTLVGT